MRPGGTRQIAIRVASALLAVLLGAGAASARPIGSEPSLTHEGGREVAPGERIELTWTGAEDVRELELLLSLDGGRTYPVQVSPHLAPGAHLFAWRVPALPGTSLRLRIRYNRGGVEVEGPPSRVFTVHGSAAGGPEPMGLPPADAASDNRASRPESSTGVRAAVASDDDALARRVCAGASAGARLPRTELTRRDLVLAASAPADRAPRFVPMRP